MPQQSEEDAIKQAETVAIMDKLAIVITIVVLAVVLPDLLGFTWHF